MDRTKIIACLSGLLLASCSGHTHIVVGSKNFTEQVILGEILAQQIERRLGVPGGAQPQSWAARCWRTRRWCRAPSISIPNTPAPR
jgi:hypothetical protein